MDSCYRLITRLLACAAFAVVAAIFSALSTIIACVVLGRKGFVYFPVLAIAAWLGLTAYYLLKGGGSLLEKVTPFEPDGD